jgi:hypothetical protein
MNAVWAVPARSAETTGTPATASLLTPSAAVRRPEQLRHPGRGRQGCDPASAQPRTTPTRIAACSVGLLAATKACSCSSSSRGLWQLEVGGAHRTLPRRPARSPRAASANACGRGPPPFTPVSILSIWYYRARAHNRPHQDRPGGTEVATSEREARLEELFAGGWTTEPLAEFWAAPDLRYIPSIITDDVVGYWPRRADRPRRRAVHAGAGGATRPAPRSPSRGAGAHDEPRWQVRLLALGDPRNRCQRPIRARGDG